MPRQKFCSVPGCLSTTELVKREQEVFLSASCGQCQTCRPCRCPAPDIYTTRKETRNKFATWTEAIGIKQPGYYINVCYKHFSAGCPSRSCPNPDVIITPAWQRQGKQVRRQQQQLAGDRNGGNKSKVVELVSGGGGATGRRRRQLLQQQVQRPPRRHIDRSTSTGSTTSSCSSSSSYSESGAETFSKRLPPHLCKFLSTLMKQQPASLAHLATPPPPPGCPLPKTPLTPSALADHADILPLIPVLLSSREVVLSDFNNLDYHAMDVVGSSLDQDAAAERSSIKEETALMETSEDPCLNDGAKNFISPFTDEHERVKWLDICDA